MELYGKYPLYVTIYGQAFAFHVKRTEGEAYVPDQVPGL